MNVSSQPQEKQTTMIQNYKSNYIKIKSNNNQNRKARINKDKDKERVYKLELDQRWSTKL